MELYLGIDCGGTHLRVGLVTATGQLVAWQRIHSPLKTQPNQFGAQVYQLTSQLISSSQYNLRQVKAIGIGVPGPLDRELGLILKSPNLANARPINVVEQLEQAFQLPVFLERDTNIGLIGEQWVGAAKNLQHVIMLTLGTGVGGAILINGQLYRGQHGRAGEIGHTYLDVATPMDHSIKVPVCGLGHVGCFEAIIKQVEFSQIPYYLGRALAGLIDTFDPQRIILGGGMMMQLSSKLTVINQIMIATSVSQLASQTDLKIAEMGDLSGVYGSAKVAIETIK